MNSLEHSIRNLPAKIRDYNGSLKVKQAIKIILDEVIQDYALNMSHPEQEGRNVMFVVDNYPELEPQEIGRAFEMNATGKYWESIRKYSDMSTLFIGEVLTKYQEWKRIQNQRKPLPAPRRMVSNQDRFNHMIELMNLYGTNYFNLNWSFMYEFALKCGMYHNKEEVKAVLSKLKKENPDQLKQFRKIEAMKFLFLKYYDGGK